MKTLKDLRKSKWLIFDAIFRKYGESAITLLQYGHEPLKRHIIM